MVRNITIAGVVGVMLLTVTLAFKLQAPPNLSDADIYKLAAQDDPEIGAPRISKKNSLTDQKDEILVYLPECSGCTMQDQLPNPLPSVLENATFIKRTGSDIPPELPSEKVKIDTDGSIQRKLNAFQTPRIYIYRDGKLAEFQRLDQTANSFISRMVQ